MNHTAAKRPMNLRAIIALALLISVFSHAPFSHADVIPPAAELEKKGTPADPATLASLQDHVKESSESRLKVVKATLRPLNQQHKQVLSCDAEITFEALEDCYVWKTKMLDKGIPLLQACNEKAAKTAGTPNPMDFMRAGDQFNATLSIVRLQDAKGKVRIFFNWKSK